MEKYLFQGLDCANCALKLEEEIKKLGCVDFVSINFATLSMKIKTSDIDSVKTVIKKNEPDVSIQKFKDNNETKQFQIRKELLKIGISAIAFILALIFQDQLEKNSYHLVEALIFISIYLFTGWKVLFNAFRNITQGKIFDENFLMTIATLGAIAIHALSEAAGVMLFYKVGEFFQELSLFKSRKSIKALLEIRPDYANLKVNETIVKVAPEKVAIGNQVIVKPGEKIPLDGIVVSGETQIDTSALTGESVPRVIKEKDVVLAGMINKSGLITIKVTKLFEESSISKILELVENAIHKKAKTEQFFTTFAKYYTPIIVLIAAMTAILPPLILTNETFSSWIYRALVILVVSCPCALVVSIPLAYFGGIGGASKNGILIKGSNYLDMLNSVKTIVLDKTGTLTKGIFKVNEVVPVNGFTKEQLLKISAEAEAQSNHPIAISLREANGSSINTALFESYQELEGMGIVAKFKEQTVLVGNDRLLHKFNITHDTCHVSGTVVHVALNQVYAGHIIIGDSLKEDTADAIRILKAAGIEKVVMLTGDNKEIAKAVAEQTGIDEFYAELLPEDKVSKLEDMMRNKKSKTAFVGDGINDAPVLARADIGISMGGIGTDAAIETADVVIMNDSLMKIPEAIQIAKKTKRILFQNIFFALGVKALFIVLGFIGIATMWEAVFGDMGVALLAIFNATRVLNFKKFQGYNND